MIFAIDYTPTINGLPFDVTVGGGTVGPLRLYSTADHSGSIVADIPTATALPGNVWQFLVQGVPDGRYWMDVTWTPDAQASPVVDDSGYVDLPIRPDLLVSAEDVAHLLRIPLPLSAATRFSLHQYIHDAQAAVISALGPIFPRTLTATGLFPYGDLDSPASWFSDTDQVGRILGVVANPGGTYDVTYTYGLDATGEDPIRLFVKYHAAALFAGSTEGIALLGRRMTSLSVEGQSASFASGADAAPGGMIAQAPTLEGLVLLYRGAKPKAFQRRTPGYVYDDRNIWTY